MGIFELLQRVIRLKPSQAGSVKSARIPVVPLPETSARGVIKRDEWVASQRVQYGSREGLSDRLSQLAGTFNRELRGISGPLIDDLLNAAPRMIPIDYWGADLGWRSKTKQSKWAELLLRNDIVIAPDQVGILVEFRMNAAEWVPHPYVPPNWTLSDFRLFSQYVLQDESIFELCRTWRTENSIALTRKLTERLQKYGVLLGASYRSYERADYAMVAFQYPYSSSAIDVVTVWKGETELSQLVRSIFPDACREYTAVWLGRQRIDIFVPSRKLAFEYHGEQHYHSIEYFGGEAGHKATRERDARKRNACKKAGVVLIEWKYSEGISRDRLIAKLRQSGIDIEQPNQAL